MHRMHIQKFKYICTYKIILLRCIIRYYSKTLSCWFVIGSCMCSSVWVNQTTHYTLHKFEYFSTPCLEGCNLQANNAKHLEFMQTTWSVFIDQLTSMLATSESWSWMSAVLFLSSIYHTYSIYACIAIYKITYIKWHWLHDTYIYSSESPVVEKKFIGQ